MQCEENYIKQTKRYLHKCVEEHLNTVKNNTLLKIAFSEHLQNVFQPFLSEIADELLYQISSRLKIIYNTTLPITDLIQREC